MSEPARQERLQLHLTLPYNIQPRKDGRVAGYLAQGYRIEQLQRITDREVLITLARGTAVDPAGS